MNLGESMKYVLKNRGQMIFTTFWQDDLRGVLKDVGNDFFNLAGQRQQRPAGPSYQNFTSSIGETINVFKIIPRRMKQGFGYFKEDFLSELEQLPNSKQKTIFSMKVLGGLTRHVLTSVYSLKKSQTLLQVKGVKYRNAFTQFLVAELIIRIGQVFVLRLMSEVEKEVDDLESLNHIKYLKSVLRDPSHSTLAETDFESTSGDRSLEIVENLKNYITTGVR
jgi:hypothetical protein